MDYGGSYASLTGGHGHGGQHFNSSCHFATPASVLETTTAPAAAPSSSASIGGGGGGGYATSSSPYADLASCGSSLTPYGASQRPAQQFLHQHGGSVSPPASVGHGGAGRLSALTVASSTSSTSSASSTSVTPLYAPFHANNFASSSPPPTSSRHLGGTSAAAAASGGVGGASSGLFGANGLHFQGQ